MSQVLHERLNATHATRHRSFLFIWFTVALLATHARLITMNWSTVEQLNTSRMKERETRVLSRLHAWYQFDAKRRTKQEWDEQWGRIGKEGNLYWLGSARKNWEAVMGDKWYQWIRESYLYASANTTLILVFSASWTDSRRRPDVPHQPSVRPRRKVAAPHGMAT